MKCSDFPIDYRARSYSLLTEAGMKKRGSGGDCEVDPCALSWLYAAGESGGSRHVKFYLTDSKGLSLLCIGGRCNLLAVRSIQSTEYAHMNNIQVVTRFAQGLLAAGVTTAAVLVFHFAMLVG